MCLAWNKDGENQSITLHTGHWEKESLHLALMEAEQTWLYAIFSYENMEN